MLYTETQLTEIQTQLDIIASRRQNVEDLYGDIKDQMKPLLSALEKLPSEMRERFCLDCYEPMLHDIESAESVIYEIEEEIQDALYQIKQCEVGD